MRRKFQNPGSKSRDLTLFSRYQFFDLPDYFTHRCTKNNTRSFCSTARKCSFYLTRMARGFPYRYRSRRIDRRRLTETNWSSKRTNSGCGDTSWQGTHAKSLLGSGVSKKAPLFGVVSSSPPPLTATAALNEHFGGILVKGIWVLTWRGSPLTGCTCSSDSVSKDATFPNWWMNEGGQCSKGRLTEFIITTHAVYSEPKERAKQGNRNIQVCCNRSRRTYTSI
ncbi:hypothetical protein EV401DRAFT_2042319 [Pisolithus croceorrhizus]|nr:hypothetical protein EV401DRAFT_2042319 [Pisolithus croceorrhizus]